MAGAPPPPPNPPSPSISDTVPRTAGGSRYRRSHPPFQHRRAKLCPSPHVFRPPNAIRLPQHLIASTDVPPSGHNPTPPSGTSTSGENTSPPSCTVKPPFCHSDGAGHPPSLIRQCPLHPRHCHSSRHARRRRRHGRPPSRRCHPAHAPPRHHREQHLLLPHKLPSPPLQLESIRLPAISSAPMATRASPTPAAEPTVETLHSSAEQRRAPIPSPTRPHHHRPHVCLCGRPVKPPLISPFEPTGVPHPRCAPPMPGRPAMNHNTHTSTSGRPRSLPPSHGSSTISPSCRRRTSLTKRQLYRPSPPSNDPSPPLFRPPRFTGITTMATPDSFTVARNMPLILSQGPALITPFADIRHPYVLF